MKNNHIELPAVDGRLHASMQMRAISFSHELDARTTVSLVSFESDSTISSLEMSLVVLLCFDDDDKLELNSDELLAAPVPVAALALTTGAPHSGIPLPSKINRSGRASPMHER